MANERSAPSSADILMRDHVPSRIFAKDEMLYGFSPEAQTCALNYMGWADLSTNPPLDPVEIQAFADAAVADGIKTVVLVGQGGSAQAPMTLTKYNKVDVNRVDFKTLDSVSPVRVREVLASSKLESTLIVVASKSGSTIEPRLLLSALRDAYAQTASEEDVARHLVAVTDPGSNLERQAREEGWRAVFSGEPAVGGRFSALSVFGLLPAALAGIDVCELLEHARSAEDRCSEDVLGNPALQLAAFLHEGYLAGRDKFSLLTPKRGRVLGLWIEQLVAESLGKEGKGILPNIEVDPLLLTHDLGDRCVISYQTQTDLWDELCNFEMGLAHVNASIPRMSYRIESVYELAEHFVMWEYAIAMCGYLMEVCPFDQPDVASAKAATLGILRNGQPAASFEQDSIAGVCVGSCEVRLASCFGDCCSLEEALRMLLASIRLGDYFSLNAFLPFTGEGRREALEAIRHSVAESLGVASCLEIGPRYLHSTGQLHKGGPNRGVFLIVSADEQRDISLAEEVESLGALAKAQASGDMIALSARARRVVHVHLGNNASSTLRVLAKAVADAANEAKVGYRL